MIPPAELLPSSTSTRGVRSNMTTPANHTLQFPEVSSTDTSPYNSTNTSPYSDTIMYHTRWPPLFPPGTETSPYYDTAENHGNWPSHLSQPGLNPLIDPYLTSSALHQAAPAIPHTAPSSQRPSQDLHQQPPSTEVGKRRGRKPKALPPIEVNPDDPEAARKARNTQAARDCRERRIEKMQKLEDEVEELTKDRDTWKNEAIEVTEDRDKWKNEAIAWRNEAIALGHPGHFLE